MKKFTLMFTILAAAAALTLTGCGDNDNRAVTQPPGFQDPVTQDPVTQVPVTQVPVTQDPVTQVPQADPNDLDGDGVANALDAFPNDPAASMDADGDGFPDAFNPNATPAQLAATALTLDAFPNDPAASVDTDADGFPDAFNLNATPAQLAATALTLDAFPSDPAASVDTDGDGLPDAFNQNATPEQIAASPLQVDDDDDNDGVADVDDAAPLRGVFPIPTDGPPSPLFGAGSFEQQLLRFEEFGTEPFDPAEPPEPSPLPQPLGAESGPDPEALEAFLAQPGFALYNPVRMVDYAAPDAGKNPWKEKIEEYLGLTLNTSPAEGRPPGEWWAHQRWEEFPPQVYYTTAQAGARVNGGFRDTYQLHGYGRGEFGPGGLYHQVYASDGGASLTGTTNGLGIRFHPNMPLQDPQALWTFDGTLPPKLLMVRYGQAVLMRHYNALPIDKTANRGFGMHTITTHEHNGHSPGESDGFAGAFFYPGQFWDYRWPLQLAGYDTINTDASEPRAAFPCEPGETLPVDDDGDGVPTLKTCDANGRIQLRGDWRETMSTHWFHDHMLDHTAENVYKGNAVMMNYYSALDRGNEAFGDGVNLRFPSGTELSWGNRDYDVNLLVADKSWDQEGQLWFSHNAADGHDGFIGDQVLANWLYHPYLEVRARSYRFRILNGAVSRIFALALVQQVQGDAGEIPGPPESGVSYNRVPFHMIANDGNIMEHAVPFDGSMDLDGDGELIDHKGQLPSQGIAERYDIIVDFSKNGIQAGDKLYFVNLMEQEDGKGTKGKIPLEEVLSEGYKAELTADNRWINGDPAVGKFLELRVREYAGQDLSMNPADFEPGKLTMIPLPIDRNDPELLTADRHTFEFVRSQGGSATPWKIRVDGGEKFSMNPNRVSALMRGDLEIWSLQGNHGWTHPVHIHFEEGVILTRGGKTPPQWELWARKDLYRVGPEEDSDDVVEVAIRARDFVGTFMEHCHNTMHEDHAMLLRWDAQHPDQLELAPTPVPTWDGVQYGDSHIP